MADRRVATLVTTVWQQTAKPVCLLALKTTVWCIWDIFFFVNVEFLKSLCMCIRVGVIGGEERSLNYSL